MSFDDIIQIEDKIIELYEITNNLYEDHIFCFESYTETKSQKYKEKILELFSQFVEWCDNIEEKIIKFTSKTYIETKQKNIKASLEELHDLPNRSLSKEEVINTMPTSQSSNIHDELILFNQEYMYLIFVAETRSNTIKSVDEIIKELKNEFGQSGIRNLNSRENKDKLKEILKDQKQITKDIALQRSNPDQMLNNTDDYNSNTYKISFTKTDSKSLIPVIDLINSKYITRYKDSLIELERFVVEFRKVIKDEIDILKNEIDSDYESINLIRKILYNIVYQLKQIIAIEFHITKALLNISNKLIYAIKNND